MNNLQTKLTLFETPPPEGVWDKIADGLHTQHTFAERLYGYAPAPPGRVWAAVEEALSPAKVVPFSVRFRRPTRYAAAASIIGVVLIASTLLVRRTEAGSLSVEPGGGSLVVQQSFFANPFKNLQVGGSSSRLTVNEVKALLQRKRRVSFVKPQLSAALPILQSLNVSSFCNHGPVNGYITASDGDGVPLSLSPRLFTMFGCSAHGPVCTSRIKALRDSLSAFGMTPLFPAVMETLHDPEQKP